MREVRLVLLLVLKASALAVLLLSIAVVAVLEYADLPTPYPLGSSPINPGHFGTSMLVELLKDYGLRVSYVTEWSRVRAEEGRVCVLIVSPEYGYGRDEASAIAELLASSGGVLVVADETTSSNTVLELLGAGARVLGNRLLDERYDYYPRSTFYLGAREAVLRLDKASEVRGCETVIGLAESYEYPSTEAELKPVGCLERLGRVTVLVLGDGSPLTNQAQQLGGVYRELAKFVAHTIREECGRECRVLVEAGKYASYVGPVSRVHEERAPFLEILNGVFHYLKALEGHLTSDPLEGVRNEVMAVLVLVVVVTASARFGGSGVSARPLKSFAWRGREDFGKVFEALAELLSLLGCGTDPGSELVRCLESAGYSREFSAGLSRFIELSKSVLDHKALTYLPIWRFMIGRALRYSEELLKVSGERFLGGRSA